MLKKIIIMLAASILLASCGSEPTQTGTSLVGTTWELVSFNRQKPIGHRAITLSFDSSFRVSGNAGCNRYAGLVNIKGSRLHMDLSQKEFDENKNRILTTKMYCPSPTGLMDQEQRYLEQLTNSRKFSVQGNQLIIKNGADALVYKPYNNNQDGK